MMKKTLFISDLDGTLLDGSERVSERSREIINGLIEQGMLFTCATGRSTVRARRAVSGLNISIPLITCNGAVTMDTLGKLPPDVVYMEKESAEFSLDAYLSEGAYPLVYAFIDGVDTVSYAGEYVDGSAARLVQSLGVENPWMRNTTPEGLKDGDIYYISGLDEEQPLSRARERIMSDSNVRIAYQKDEYGKGYWLELMSPRAAKANAALRLMERLGCERIVCFGDGENDLALFEVAEESYAVIEACEGVKEKGL